MKHKRIRNSALPVLGVLLGALGFLVYNYIYAETDEKQPAPENQRKDGSTKGNEMNNNQPRISAITNETTRQLTTFNLKKKSKTVAVHRGKRVTIGEVKGQGRIQNIWMTFTGWFWGHWNPDAPVSQTILKTLILRIYWDGEDTPAVQCPVGDFFGNGLCETSNFASQYFGMSSGGFFCKFPMPFRKGFRIELENKDEKVDTSVFMNVLYQLTDEPISEDEGYFHAQFRTKMNIDGLVKNPVELLEAQGRGHFAGCTLSMQGSERNNISFLEAPEHFYIDDEQNKPTITGTGLEDYFMGGWYFKEEEFTGPLHGVPEKDYFNSSVAMYRIHEKDAIHFQKRIRFCFTNYADYRIKPFSYSSAAFYYLDSPAGQEPEIPKLDDLLCWYRIKETDHWTTP